MMGMHTKDTTRDSVALQDKQLWEVLTTPGLKRPGEGIVLRPKDKTGLRVCMERTIIKRHSQIWAPSQGVDKRSKCPYSLLPFL